MKCSIIIPCWNAEHYVGQAINSALAQTTPNVELIVVEDCSTDATPEILKSYGSKICALQGRGEGATAARNVGFAKARGDHIQFFDADDIMHPEKIARQVAILREHPGKIAACAWRPFQERVGDMAIEEGADFGELSPAGYLRRYLSDPANFPNPSFLAPRELVEMAGPWDESLKVNQDGEFTARLVAASDGVVHVGGEPLWFYRKQPLQAGSVSNINSTQKVRSAMLALDKIAETAARIGVDVDATRLADKYYRLMVSSYPLSRSLIPDLLQRIERHGGKTYGPRLGGHGINTLARLIGWKAARHIQLRWQRLKGVA